MNGFGFRLKTWRKKLGMTQAQFSEKTEIHLAQIKKYETDASLPSGEIMAKIAETGVNLNWLLTGQGYMVLNLDEERVEEGKIPSDLAELDERFQAIFGLLQGMDSKKQASTVDELFSRVQEVQRVDEMERIIKEMKKALDQAG